MAAAVKKQGLFSRIETREDALKVVRTGSITFLALAGLQALIGVFIAPGILFDAAILTVLALLIWKTHSRFAAVVLALVVSGEAIVTFLNRIGVMSAGGNNIFLAVLMVILSIRLVEATFKLNGKLALPAWPQPPAGPAGVPAMGRPGAPAARVH